MTQRSGVGWRHLIAASLAALLLNTLFVLPHHPAAMTAAAFARIAMETPIVLLMLLALPPQSAVTRVVIWLLALAVLLLTVLKVADYAMFEAFNRPFNPAIDGFFVIAGLDLLRGSVGAAWATVAVVGAVAGMLILGGLVFVALRSWARLSLPSVPRRIAGGIAALGCVVAVADTGRTMGAWSLPLNPPGYAFTARIGAEHIRDWSRARAELDQFAQAAANDPYRDASGLFATLEERDVQIVFVESYGRTSFTNPLYTPSHMATLRNGETALTDSGLAMRSGWLASPISGGQSWLAHGTFASGLVTADQARYAALLRSDRATLYDLARHAGYRSAAIMPAITLPWPEGPMLGFDAILKAPDLKYRGTPFNWITMPDQYTLSAWKALLPPDPRPDFTQIALISSHAPWVPVPELLPWEDVDDGPAFERFATAGDPPEVVWRDRDRVREQYRRAVDYALQTTLSYAARQAGPEAPLMVILGDHQPAGFVSQSDSRDVPIHIIGPPEVLAWLDGWGWTTGLIPAETQPSLPMEAFRDKFVAAFSAPLIEDGGT
jgi:hypothetical protein